MTTPLVPSLIDEQLADIERSVPDDRILMAFKGPTMVDAQKAAAESFIENPAAWSQRHYWCGEWTLSYEVRV